MPEFNKAMEQLKLLSVAAWEEMSQYAPGMWSRAGYSTHTNCDLQVNNMCEAFNFAIIDLRDLPIISLVEGLKFYISNRIVKLRDYMLRYQGDICPMIKKIVEKAKKDAVGWSPHWCGDRDYSLFSVTDGIDTYVVNLIERTCACRKWDLTGIPCCHVIAAIYYNQANPEDYVAHWYRKQTFLDTYNNIILPSNGPKLWPQVDTPPILPPYMRRAPGRPKKARRKENDEPKSTSRKGKRNQETVRCKRCKELGHNIRTCGGKTGADRSIPPGGNKDNPEMQHPESSTAQATTTNAAPTVEATNTTDAQATIINVAPTAEATNITGAQATTQQAPTTTVTKKTRKPRKKKAKTAAVNVTPTTAPSATNGTPTNVPAATNGTTTNAPPATTSALNASNAGPSASVSNATNTSGTMRGGTGVKRSTDEVGNVGTQQSVNKT